MNNHEKYTGQERNALDYLLGASIEVTQKGLGMANYLGDRLAHGAYRKAEAYGLVGRTLVTRLAQDARLHTAVVGRSAVQRGKKVNDPELQYTGEAMILKEAVRAQEDPNIPQNVREQIVDIAIEEGIDPRLSPLLPDETAERARQLIARQDNVTMFRKPQNDQNKL